MKNILLLIGAIFLLVFSCKGQENGSQAAAGASVNLTFWDMAWGDTSYAEEGKSLTSKFNQTAQDVKVKYVPKPWTNFYQTFSTAVATNSAPDVATGSAFLPWDMAEKGVALHVDDVYEKWRSEGKLDDIVPSLLPKMKYQGHYIAFPIFSDIRMVYYNQSILDAMNAAGLGTGLPQTWDELKQLAIDAVKGGFATYGFALPGNDYVAYHIIAMLMGNYGGGLFSTDGKPLANTPQNIQVLSYLKDLLDAGALHNAMVSWLTSDAERNFKQGKILFIVNGSMVISEEQKDTLKILPIPLRGSNSEPSTLNNLAPLMAFSAKNNTHPEAAKQFFQWWAENYLELYQNDGLTNPPAWKSARKLPTFATDTFETVYQWFEVAGTSMVQESKEIFPEANRLDGAPFLKEFSQNILKGMPPEENLDWIQGELEKLFS